MRYEHDCAKMECCHGTGALMNYLDERSADGWEMIAFQIIGISAGSPIAVPGQPQAQQTAGWFMIFRRRIDGPPCACGESLPMG